MIMAVAVAGGLADLISQCQIATVVWHNHLKGCGAVGLGLQSFECCGLSACGPGRRVRICPPLATEGLKEYMARAENGRGQGQPHMLYFFPSHFPTSSHQIVVGIALAKLYSADRLLIAQTW